MPFAFVACHATSAAAEFPKSTSAGASPAGAAQGVPNHLKPLVGTMAFASASTTAILATRARRTTTTASTSLDADGPATGVVVLYGIPDFIPAGAHG